MNTLETMRTPGFAPTACVVHPQTGDLYVSIGGRGTRGAVYRIRYPQGLAPDIAAKAKKYAPTRRSLARGTLRRDYTLRSKLI